MDLTKMITDFLCEDVGGILTGIDDETCVARPDDDTVGGICADGDDLP